MSKKAKTNAKVFNQGKSSQLSPGTSKQTEPRLFYQFKMQALILVIVGFIFYCNTFTHGSAFDDRMAITSNEYVQKGLSGIPDILTKDAFASYLEQKGGSNQLAGGRYRPLSMITFAIEQQLLGIHDDAEPARESLIEKDMPFRHVVNVLLYIVSAILLLQFLRNIVFPASPEIAFLAALLFLVHPIHTEVVANVKSRDEILSVLFISLTFLYAFRYRESGKMQHLVFGLVSFFLALLSKEYAVTLIALLPLSLYVFGNETIIKSTRATLPFLLPLALYLALRLNAVSGMAEGADKNVLNNPYLYATGTQAMATKLWVLLDYLKLLVFPHPLIADYSYRQIPYTNLNDPLVWLSIVVYLALFIVLYILFKRKHVLCFAIAVFLANLLLVSNFVVNVGAPMGERLVYHSSIGFAIALAYLLYQGYDSFKGQKIAQNAFAGLVVILVALSGYKTIARNMDWKNDETLFLTDIVTAPNSVLINNDAAACYMKKARESKNEPETRNKYFREAISYFDRSINIFPGNMLGYMNRGLCYFNMGFPDRALTDWDTVRKYDANRQNLSKYLSIAGNHFFGLGLQYQKEGKGDSAIYFYQRSIEAVPESAEVWYRLGSARIGAGQKEDGIADLKKALQLAPGHEGARKMLDMLAVP